MNRPVEGAYLRHGDTGRQFDDELYTVQRYLQYSQPTEGWDWRTLTPGRQLSGRR